VKSLQKLELTWIGKDNRPKLEPRILLEDVRQSHSAPHRVTESDLFDNKLIFGDNLLGLKALEQSHAEKIQCIYIDPPYNTGSAFTHYDDGLEHSIWLSLMRERLLLLRSLLSKSGSIWISIDDNEQAYLRILCDEVFGRSNFVTTIVWEKRKTRENRRAFSFKHDFVIVFAKDKSEFEAIRNPVSLSNEVLDRYKNPDNDPRGDWQSVAITAQAGHGTASQFYTILTPAGRAIDPPPGNCWRYTRQKLEELRSDNRIYFGATGNNTPRLKKFLRESEDAGLTPESIWYAEDVGTNDSAKRHSNLLFDGKAFDSPKPEELISRIIHIGSNSGDIVLDSFAGSGTTGAVAHKMGRRWIMIELGEHCHTHIIPRMRKVIDGEDNGGITEAVNWKGGGGFRYYSLAPSLLEKDKWGQWVISKEFNANMLAEAVCKLEGFTYAPSETNYWQHGYSTERDFIYVTTQQLSAEQLAALSEDLGPERTLLVLCASFRAPRDVDSRFPNLTIRKIPKQVLSQCEWGRDDYSLKVENLPAAPPSQPAVDRKGQVSLFDSDEGKR
jgi:adenine-specific DNA-methyltransferase